MYEVGDTMVMKLNYLLNKLIFFMGFVICIIIFCFCFQVTYAWYQDNKKTENLTEDIYNSVSLEEDTDHLDVDLSTIINQNSDTKGWLKVENTNINYPFVQTSNNDYYLTHSFDKTSNEAGWVFLDFRNDINNLSENTIIYAHDRLDKSMFGSLENTLSQDWYNNTNNHIIKMTTEKYHYEWQVFSTYVIDTETYYIQTTFNTKEEYLDFLVTIKSRSQNQYDVDLSTDDKILTLSTCHGDYQKMVLHAKLIKVTKNTSFSNS